MMLTSSTEPSRAKYLFLNNHRDKIADDNSKQQNIKFNGNKLDAASVTNDKLATGIDGNTSTPVSLERRSPSTVANSSTEQSTTTP